MLSAEQPMRTADNWHLRRWHIYLLAAGIIIRLALSVTLNVEQSYGGWDGHEYHAYAINLLNVRGDDYPRTFNEIRAPGYPIFLIPFVAISEQITWHIQVIQCFLGGLLTLILARVAARWCGSRAADFAFVISLFYPALVY